jgi:alanine racemase
MEKDLTIAMSRTWAEINLDALEKNVEILRGILSNNAKFLGVCKANAYGHGLVRVAKKLEECKADYIAVACVEEAIELRKNGITIPILCFGQSNPELTDLICKYDITQTVENLENGKLISEKAVKLQKKVRIHVKIDTGMGRIGFYWPEAGDSNIDEKKETAKAISELCKLPGIEAEGIFTHFADADNEEYTYSQIKKFKEALEYLSNIGTNFKLAHSSASVGVAKYPEAHFSMGRFGLILYGYVSTETGNKDSNLNLIPIMTVKSRISAVRKLPEGITVSYGCTHKLKRDSNIAVIPIGYADGFPRCLSNKANIKIHDTKCPILGRVCMDMIMVDVTDVKGEVKAGDIAIIFDEELVVEDAQKAGTIVHEIISQVLPRVTRIYIDKGKMTL